MADYQQNSDSRSQRRQQKNNRMNRLLNYLIVLVIALIGIASYIIFFTGDEQAQNEQQADEQANDVNTNDVNEQDNVATNDTNSNESDDFDEADASTETESSDTSNDSQQTEQSIDNSSQENVTMPSTDPVVDEVIVNPNWQPTKTAQTEPHTSVFQEGHIDYEEKLATVFAVTSLSEADSIVWDFRNNGSANSAIAVVSSADKTEKYRVSMEWVANEGWKPVKLEKLNTIEGSW